MTTSRLVMAALCSIAFCALAPAAQPAPYGIAQRPPMDKFLNGRMPELGPGVSGNWDTVVAFPKLAFKNAIGVLPMPGTNRLVVWEREGRIWSFENDQQSSDKTLVLDISNKTQGWDDSGLLGLAFHPDFAKNHYVYLWYTYVTPGHVGGDPEHRPPTDSPNSNHLSRFTVGANGMADPVSEVVLIDQPSNVIWHKGGGMFFHPTNGFLYLTIGDDEDPSNSQRIDNNLFGGLLRIDVDERGGKISHPIPRQPASGHTAHYFIPNDNPFVGKPNVLEEFYGIGLRSPHRMTYDAISKRIFIADVGDATREEVNIIEPTDPAGLNFGWPQAEGLLHRLVPPYIGVEKQPVIDYDHGDGMAVIGGYVYRGKKWADDLGGHYIFGDNGTNKIWVLDERTTPGTKMQIATLPFGPGPNSGGNYTGLSSFGLDADGELYLCQMSSVEGHLFRLERNGPPVVRKPFPRLLSQTGAFSDTAHLIAAPGLIPYTVNSPLWSDGAIKSRWVAVPSGASIKAPATGDWEFPEGTVFVKHFELAIDAAHPEKRRRLETRLLVRDRSGGAYGVSYKWREDNSDAELLPDSRAEWISITDAAGKTHKQPWYYPSQNDCLRCHTPAAKFVLGVKTRQLNGAMSYGANKDNQLRVWNHLGLLDPEIDESRIDTMARSVRVTDAAAPLEARVRSYLDSNCAHCHRPGGVNALWDARFDTALPAMNVINANPITRLGPPNSRIVRPRDLAHSLMTLRLGANNVALQMPPLARNVVDADALAVISQWIATLPVPDPLPRGWVAEDVGNVGIKGETLFSRAKGLYSLAASGADIWDTADGFHFVYQPVKGDVTITARVLSVGEGDEWTKAAVMIRQSTAPESPHAMMAITRENGASFQRRRVAAQESEHTPGPEARAPYWVRLQRRGNKITGFVSQYGGGWTKVDEVEIDLGEKVLVGLALTSHNDAALNNAEFDRVKVEK